jgi:hypothetical protein
MSALVPQSPEEVVMTVSRLTAERERLGRLPVNSAYAVHRKRCVDRALAILSPPDSGAAFAAPPPEALDELSALLNSLSMR